MTTLLPREQEDEAACRSGGTELFYEYGKGNGIGAKEVIRLFCDPCPVRFFCLLRGTADAGARRLRHRGRHHPRPTTQDPQAAA